MKKLTYLLTILFAVVLLNTSCEKEPIEMNLDGTWVSTMYEYNDNVYTTNDELNENVDTKDKDLMLITITINNNVVDLSDNYNTHLNYVDKTYDFNGSKNEITIKSSGQNLFVFKVLAFDSETLKLQLTYENISGIDVPISINSVDGIYTLRK